MTLRLKIAQKPYRAWFLGPKALKYESLEPYPGTPNSPKQVLFTDFRPQSRYYLYTWSPRARVTEAPLMPSASEAAAPFGALTVAATTQRKPRGVLNPTHRPLSSSLLWCIFRILEGNPKKELLSGLWDYPKPQTNDSKSLNPN